MRRAYLAISLDGKIADQSGGVGFLAPFEGMELGYDAFYATIDALVIGRATYDQVRGFGPWPYPGKRTWVLTSKPLEDPPPGVEALAGGIDGLRAALAAHEGGDVWLVGGAALIQAALACGLIDRLELVIVPVIVGAGVSLFGDAAGPELRRGEVRELPGGVVEIHYWIGPERA